jgi:2-methylcitrate dehydratase PrpD
VQRSDIQAFFPKVKVHSVNAYDTRDPAHSPTERVLVRLKNGDVLDSGVITTIRGHANDPMSVEELWRKFEECTALTHSSAEAKRLFELLQRIDDLPSAKTLPTCGTILRS